MTFLKMKKTSQANLSKRVPGLALGTLILALASGSAHAQLQDGLLSYWDFEENFEDSAATYGTDSTVADNGTGGTAVVFASDGPLGSYGDFQRTGLGTENFVVVAESADINAAGKSLTVSAWFRVDGFDQGWQTVISHGEGNDWRIARRADDQGLGYAGGVGDIPGSSTSPDVNDGNWHHVLAITEAGVSARLWVDGSLIATSANPANIADNGAGVLYLGGNPQGNPDDTDVNQYRPWNGGLDDIALWNRPLTDAEIREIYLAGNSGISLGSWLNPQDDDNDGLPNEWEIAHELDPNDDGSTDVNNGPAGDPDNDGSNNLAEFTNLTDPNDDDSDDDFSLDGAEATNGTDPHNPDSDGDGLLDGHETKTGIYISPTNTGTDPLLADTDLDGFDDALEITLGSDPNDINDIPKPSGLPLIDDFEDNILNTLNWKAIAGTVSQNAEGTALGGALSEAGGVINFGSRGYLHTVAEYDPEAVGGLEINGELTMLSGDDFFSILTRTDAVPLQVYGEATSGIQFVISGAGDNINISARNGDHVVENVVIEGSIDFLVNTPYLFTVIDDGLGALSLTVTDKADPAITISATAELTADTGSKNLVGFYNREGGRNSTLEEVTIKSLTGNTGTEITEISYDSDGDQITLTWTSRVNTDYAIYWSPNLMNWEAEITDAVPGEEGTTSFSFAHPSPGLGKIFFRIEPPRE